MASNRNLANLVVKMTGLTKPFEKSMERSTKALNTFQDQAKKVTPTLSALGSNILNPAKGLSTLTTGLGRASNALFSFKSLLIVSSGIAFGAFIKMTLESADIIQKLSERLNTSVDELSGFRLAMIETGANAEDLPNVLNELNNKLGEAAEGGGGAVNAFKRLNISLKSIENLNTIETLKVISDRFVELESVQDKAFIANQLFGGANISLINTLELGSKALTEYEEKARKLGLTFDEVQGQQIARANDAMERLSLLVTGISRQLAIQFTPFVIKASEALSDMAQEGGGVGKKVFDLFERGILLFANLIDKINFLRKGFLSLGIVGAQVWGGIIMALQLLSHGISFITGGIVLGFSKAFSKVLEIATNGVNGVIKALNKIPGVDLELFDSSDLRSRINEFSSELEGTLGKAGENALKDVGRTGNFFKGIENDLTRQVLAIEKSGSAQEKALKFIRNIQKEVRQDAEGLLNKQRESLGVANKFSEGQNFGSFQQRGLSTFASGVETSTDRMGNLLDLNNETQKQTGVLEEIRDTLQNQELQPARA